MQDENCALSTYNCYVYLKIFAAITRAFFSSICSGERPKGPKLGYVCGLGTGSCKPRARCLQNFPAVSDQIFATSHTNGDFCNLARERVFWSCISLSSPAKVVSRFSWSAKSFAELWMTSSRRGEDAFSRCAEIYLDYRPGSHSAFCRVEAIIWFQRAHTLFTTSSALRKHCEGLLSKMHFDGNASNYNLSNRLSLLGYVFYMVRQTSITFSAISRFQESGF